MVYLNNAGTSWPKPEPVRAAVRDALEASPEIWAGRFATDHSEICRAFGVDDPSRLLLTPGATSALSVAITDHPWESGDRIVVSSLEHHALHRPAQLLASRGVELTVVPRAQDGPLDLTALEAELRRGRVRMVAMTAASNVTGELLPIAEIVGLARNHGALSLVDAAQIAGWIPIDVRSFGADLLAFTGHKGPQAPWGIGALFVAPEVTMFSPLATCEVPADGASATCAPMPGYCDVGSVDRAALAGLVAGLSWLAGPGRSDRLSQARRRVARIAEAIADHPKVSIHGSLQPDDRMPTLAMTVEGRTPSELAEALANEGVIASGGLQCAPLAHETIGTAPAGVLRLSVGPSNTDDDIGAAIEALTRCF